MWVRNRAGWAVVVVVAVLMACAGPASRNSPTAGEDGSVTGNPATLVPPITTTEAPQFRLPVEPLVAFLDGCIIENGLVGPCHCAGERLERDFDRTEMVIFEDRLSGRNEFAPEIAGSLVECRDAAPPAAWSGASIDVYIDACTKGSDRLADLCRCSTGRAQNVIPEDRLADFLASEEVQPNLVDLINTCL